MIKVDAGKVWYQSSENSVAEFICDVESELISDIIRYFSPVGDSTFNEYSYRMGFKDGWKLGRDIK